MITIQQEIFNTACGWVQGGKVLNLEVALASVMQYSSPVISRAADGGLSANNVALVLMAANCKPFYDWVPLEERQALTTALEALGARLALISKGQQHQRNLFMYCANNTKKEPLE